jgi:hypothetical protein
LVARVAVRCAPRLFGAVSARADDGATRAGAVPVAVPAAGGRAAAPRRVPRAPVLLDRRVRCALLLALECLRHAARVGEDAVDEALGSLAPACCCAVCVSFFAVPLLTGNCDAGAPLPFACPFAWPFEVGASTVGVVGAVAVGVAVFPAGLSSV